MFFQSELRKIRQRTFLTQEDFAKMINVSFSTVNRWEGGKAKPSLSAMKKIKKFCLENEINFADLQEAWLNYNIKAENNN